MKKQYFIGAHGYLERVLFYEYVHNNFKVRDVNFDKEEMCHSTFPFVIDLKKKVMYILKSITCCAMAAQNNRIISIEEFKESV